MSYSNPYSSAEQGHGYGGQQDYEMNNYGAETTTPPTLSQNDFLQRVGHLRGELASFQKNVQAISSMHARALDEADNGMSAQQVERLTVETKALIQGIRDELKFLAQDAANTRDGSKNTKDNQVNTIKNNFQNELHAYQDAENAYRQRYRDQIARQYRIVNPNATEQEVQEAASTDWGNEGVFQTALRTNRTGQANSVLGNVRARHNELQRIEQTITELAEMFQDLAVLVEQQEIPVQTAVNNAEDTTKHIDEGNAQVYKAQTSARNRRKWKWYCLLVVVLILVVIAIALALYFTVGAGGKKNQQ
ncbi:t-SNARE [Apiospora rasikravindrae]|uniref:t-SNARE n=1 Tax=Apiospora rasikravindrae TaxID=990691 RepID=A0ABR1TG97_9PEZI